MNHSNDTNSMSESDGDDRSIECRECDKTFATRYSLNRHRENIHDEKEDLSDTDSESDESSVSDDSKDSDSDNNKDSVSDDSEGPDSESSDSEGSDSESDKESENDNVLSDFVGNACVQNAEKIEAKVNKFMEDGISEEKAETLAHKKLLPQYRKSLRKIIANHFIDTIVKHEHPLMKKIYRKFKSYQNKGFDMDTAIKNAVRYYKYSIDNLIQLKTEVDCQGIE